MDTVFFCRYIDDLLFIVSDDQADLNVWLHHLNNNNLNLKFTGHLHDISIEFLDVQLSGRNGAIVTGPTAGNALLRANSGHLGQTIRGVPVGQFLRLKRLCSEDVDFPKEAEDMAHRFSDRGYPEKVLNRVFCVASEIPRNTLL